MASNQKKIKNVASIIPLKNYVASTVQCRSAINYNPVWWVSVWYRFFQWFWPDGSILFFKFKFQISACEVECRRTWCEMDMIRNQEWTYVPHQFVENVQFPWFESEFFYFLVFLLSKWSSLMYLLSNIIETCCKDALRVCGEERQKY